MAAQTASRRASPSRKTKTELQTILGAGGAIGTLLARELRPYTAKVRLVSRGPSAVVGDEELLGANLLDEGNVVEAVKGSDVVYLTAGLAYRRKAWKSQWPRIMRNTIDACKRHGAKLVFFDNVYSYSPAGLGNMTEQTPVAPVSRKGKVRAKIAQMLLDEVRTEPLEAIIVRSADFYGPGVASSAINQTVRNRLMAGKKALWFVDATKVHSATYVPDAAKATALLGNTSDAYGQVWHLPTDGHRITGRGWVEGFAIELNVAPHYAVVSKGKFGLVGMFVPLFREMKEMLYQYDRDYVFNSDKFRRRFPGFEVTGYAEGIRASVKDGAGRPREVVTPRTV